MASEKETIKRSREHLRDRGYVVGKAGSYNAYIKRNKDLYGFLDLVGLHPHERGVLGIQTTTGDHLAERVKKAEDLEAYWLWLGCCNDVEFHGWRKIKHKTKNIKIWQPRIIRVSWKDVLE